MSASVRSAPSNGLMSDVAASRFRAAPHQIIPQDQHIHFRAQEAIQGLLRPADHRLVFVERGVENHGNAGQEAERFDDRVVPWVIGALDGLQPAGAVDMRYRWNFSAAFGTNGQDLQHKRDVVVAREPVGDRRLSPRSNHLRAISVPL